MSKRTGRTFSTEFRLESAQLVIDQSYNIREAATAVGVGHSTMDKWVRQLRKEREGVTPAATAMTPEHQRIIELGYTIESLSSDRLHEALRVREHAVKSAPLQKGLTATYQHPELIKS